MKKINNYITTILLLLTLSAVQGFGQSLKTADTYYTGGAYYSAATMYKDLLGTKYQKNKDIKERRGEIIFRVAECYRRMNMIDEAQKWYLQAEGAGYTEFGLYYGYGNTQLLKGDYSGAKESFQKAKDINPSDKMVYLKLASCDTYELFGKNNNQHEIKPVVNLNTRGSEYGLSFFGDKLIFASTGVATANKPLSERTGLPYSDIYMASPDSRSLYGKVEKLEPASDNKANDGTFCYDVQANKLYFTRCEANDRNCYIAMVEIKNGKYKEKGKLKLGNQTYGIGHPYITDDGNRIYFTSVMDGGNGRSDLWYIDKDASGNYGKPVNLGEHINTAGDEVFPSFIDGILYFSSDGHAGLGGLDIFASYMENDGSFSKPFNMRAPFNSSWDDFNLVHRPGTNVGLFVSNRNNSTNSDDIYMFENFPPRLIIFSGQVYDEKTNAPITDYTVVISEDGKKLYEQRVTGDDGYFMYLSPEHKYDITVTSPEYNVGTQTISTAGMKAMGELSANTYLAKDVLVSASFISEPELFEDNRNTDIITIEMKDIFYEFDRFRLTEASKRELDKYIVYFHQYPEMKVEISSHTDARGTYEYNQTLSDQRAQAVVDYFISRGVSASRLTWKGYGMTQLMIPNARTEAEHQANRRTMFKVLSLGMAGENVLVRHVSALEMYNSPGGAVDMSGWWLQIHESSSAREIDLPEIRQASRLTGKEIRLIRCDDGRYRYCIQYKSRAEALREQLVLYKENINTVLMQF